MKFSLLILCVLICGVQSLSIISSLVKPIRVVLNPLPTLYVYDHCPYCVRVRFAFGLKNIKHNIHFLANDDIPTPTALVGKKIAPIFQYAQENIVMPESLDIIKFVDSNSKFGPPNLFKPMSNRKDINEWQLKVADDFRIFQRPRYMLSVLPEFQQQDSKDIFVSNHPVPPFEKKEWKESFTSEQRWKLYHNAYQQSFTLIDKTNKSLEDLDKFVYCEDYATEGGLSLDDVDLWARLRSVTLCKGIQWPKKLRNYMDNLSKQSDVPLYDSIAL